jgi:hypothetical protein
VQHVLPRGFVKVRHYGLLANRDRAARLAQARAVLGRAALAAAVTATEVPVPCCPVCGSRRLEQRRLLPARAVAEADPVAGAADTS